MKHLANLDGIAQARLIAKKELSRAQVLEAAIARIEALNPQIGAVVYKRYDAAKRALVAPAPEGPLSGAPFLLKDLSTALADAPFTRGSRALATARPARDSELVTRIKAGGLTIVGKTNTSEFGIQPTTEPALFGPTKNPWALDRTAGGSSGGAAAAVAARMVPIAHASDGGGSIRIPASCCGVFGLKPTRARNPWGPDVGEVMGGLVCEHAVSISVRDSAALLDATHGPDLGAPYFAPPPKESFLAATERAPGRLRIAMSKEPVTDAVVHPAALAAVDDAATLLESLGHDVFEAAPKLDGVELNRAFTVVWCAGAATDLQAIGPFESLREADFEPLTWTLAELGRGLTAPDYILAMETLRLAARQVAGFMQRCDVWLTPTVAEPPPPLGTFDDPTDAMLGFARAGAFVPFTPICNVTGQPAMSVPLYWTDRGLPMGAHLAGHFGDEETLFSLAAQLEAARPWRDRRPPICAGV